MSGRLKKASEIMFSPFWPPSAVECTEAGLAMLSAVQCIKAMARGDAESTYAGLQCAERFRIKNPSESAWVDGHWLEFVPPEYRDLVTHG